MSMRSSSQRRAAAAIYTLWPEMWYNESMKKFCIIAAVLVQAAAATSQTVNPGSIWAMPNIWPRHRQLRAEFMAAIHRGDISAMESTCRAAVHIMPNDATWRYNLACALAYREDPSEALDELEKAIDLGFRNADAIAADGDFARIKGSSRFQALLNKARALLGKPFASRPTPSTRYASAGANITLSETNFVWNFDRGAFDALLKLSHPQKPITQLADSFSKSNPSAPEAPLVSSYLGDGTGAGNAGDIYINRDRGHSVIPVGDYPQLTTVHYPKSARATNADINHPNALFSNPVFGNISRGYTKGPYWRSMARHSFTEPGLAERMDLLYRSNQFWAIPCVNDFGKPHLGDVFPANAPFQFVTVGASWTDKPFVCAALAASASFQPQTKAAILRRNLMGPTIQWLLRSTQKSVYSEAAYLTSIAHPTAFARGRLDTVRLVKTAHELVPEQIPPAVSLSIINSRLFPVKFYRPVRDYPDIMPELLMSTPSAIAFVLRAPERRRTFLFRAQSFPEKDPETEFAWRVISGHSSCVKITAPTGETLNTPERGFAQIEIDRLAITSRVDVACFAKSRGTTFGAPAIISFNPVSLEKRAYRPDGQIEYIDYENKSYVYCDPRIALPRGWKDVYDYTPEGIPLGFTRHIGGKETASFTRTGERIVEKNRDGTPKKIIRVHYAMRKTGDDFQPYELTYIDEGEPVEAKSVAPGT